MITERLKELLLNTPIKVVRYEKLLIEIEVIFYGYPIIILLDERGGFIFQMKLKAIKDIVFHEDNNAYISDDILDKMYYLNRINSLIIEELREIHTRGLV